MIYGMDLRLRVVEFVRSGASQTQASERFKISRRTVYNWLKRETLEPTKITTRKRKINKDELVKYIENNPNTNLLKLSEKFDVKMSSMSTMLKKLKIVKKNDEIQGKNVYEKM